MANDLEIRSSQALYNYSTGAIADFPDLSLIIQSPDITNQSWGNERVPKNKIKDDRLAKIFDIEEFVQPPQPNNKLGVGIQAIRFPTTLFCPVCKRIHYVDNLRKRNDLYYSNGRHFNNLNKGYFCPSCYKRKSHEIILSPTRFIIANEYGFIDDFPWDWYCHRGQNFKKNRRFLAGGTSCFERTTGTNLRLNQKGGSASLGDIEIRCTTCSASETIGNIFDQEDTFMRPYDNYLQYRNFKMPQPWLGRKKVKSVAIGNGYTEDELSAITEDSKEKLKKVFPRTLQRGAGNVHFPITHKGISLPRDSYQNKSDKLFQEVDNTLKSIFDNLALFSELNYKEQVKKLLDEGFEKYIKPNLIKKVGHKDTEVYLKNKINPSNDQLINTEKVRWQEYNCFLNFDDNNADDEEWYKSQIFRAEEYSGLGFISNIVILNKLRLLNILKGFTRVRPLALDELKFANHRNQIKEGKLDEFQRINDVRKKPESTEWLPATEVKGEGIFICLNNTLLDNWLSDTRKASQRAEQMKHNYISNLQKFDPNVEETDHDYINAKYILLHTLSHLLIEEIAQTSGYNSASLSEIIYSSKTDSEYKMSGILIYTSSTDAEGTLGGLAEHGKPRKLEMLFSNAIQKAQWCSSDPLCIETKTGQGFMGVNLSACHSCCMLPESSCENLNKFLDRGLLIGTLDKEELGFFNYLNSYKDNE